MSDITANVVIGMPSQLFTMPRSFKAVANGKIYIGQIDTDPVNPENQIPVYLENEDGSHVQVAQPIVINAGGYPVYNGQIAKFVTVQGHSMAVYDAYGAQQFYYPNVLKYDPDQFSHYAENVFSYGRFKKLYPFTFQTGATINNENEALFDGTTGMYYIYRNYTSPVTVPSGSAPNGSWVCVGLLSSYYEPGDLRNFRGVGDGVAVDTQAFILAISYANYVKERVVVPGGHTFVCDKMKFTGISSVTVVGPGCIKMIGGRSGAFYYADGAQITFINSSNIRIIGVEFDGNRSASPLYTGFNHGVQFVTATGDFRSNNGGDVKPNQNIYISECYFHDQGGYNSGLDKFGDAVYLFGCDGVIVENNYFKDVGRWAVAASDCFNVRICKNRHDCSKSGTVALGFVDIENESTDNVRGSYSKNIIISDNNITGFGQILVGAGNGSENNLGAKHYLRNVVISGNTIIIEGNTHADANYITNLIFIGIAPFCHVAPTSTDQTIDNSGILIFGNTVKCYIPSNLAIGLGINAQGNGSNSGIFNKVDGISFKGNSVFGFAKGIQAAGVSTSLGYTFTNITIEGNTIDCNGLANSIGIRAAATQLAGAMIQNNAIRGAVTRGISIEDGRAIGAIDSYIMVSENEVYGNAGTNYFANVYRASFQGNDSLGSALVLDATVNNIDKDYGNTWNHITRTINGFLVNSMSQVTQDAIDIGSQTRYGYTVQLVPPFNLEGAQSSAMVTGPGLARAFITNLSSSTVTKASDVWHLTVEKK
ncbi:TPA: phage tailspike protein [Citrobacter freundii]|nr:phage tailspike protein [Citrobacter freundii]MDN4261749.1 phage tailspike protein [Citrobacter freundii]HCB1585994.1 right-handed parallel beta-helix repeat-containing protein [Citrobacter freundii]HEE9902618.1 right-handed parallel beta-helix repeat-containing protein [Citrobacter freundii]